MNASRTVRLSALIAGAVMLAACGSNGASDSGGDSSSAVSFSPAGGDVGGAPNGATGSQPASGESLKVILTTSLKLSVENVAESYNRVGQLVRSAGGYVAAASVASSGEDGGALGLKVPASQHDGFMSSLKMLPGARVDSETVASKEVTAEYTDLQSRLRNLERTEAQFQQLLSQARTIDEILTVNGRLQTTRDEIERAKGRINLIDNQVEYATVRLQLSTLVPAKVQSDGRSDPVEVLATAWDASVALFWLALSIGAVLLVGVAWLLPVAVVTLVLMRLYRRSAELLSRLKL